MGEHNSTLTSLRLRSNRIGAQGAERLAAALERNITLTSLGLEGNSVGDNCAERIAVALEKNKLGCSVLTIRCSWQGSDCCRISCTNLGGSQVGAIDVEPQATIAAVKSALSAQSEHKGHLRLVLPDGTLLSDCGMRVAELAEGPSAAGSTATARSRSRSRSRSSLAVMAPVAAPHRSCQDSAAV